MKSQEAGKDGVTHAVTSCRDTTTACEVLIAGMGAACPSAPGSTSAQGCRQGEAGKVAVPPVHLVPCGPFTGVW